MAERRASSLDRLGRMAKRTAGAPALLRFAGTAGAAYMRFVRATSKFAIEPDNPFRLYRDLAPFILTVWHGQHMMVPYLLQPGDRLLSLVSKSRDGDAMTAYLVNFGIEVVRGSGGRDRRRTVEKGGIRGFLKLKKALDNGISIASVADISNAVARRCGEGIVALARASGRPIVPLGFATGRWIEVKSWDRATVNLPFGRAACIVGEPVGVPQNADDALVEAKRQEVEAKLNAVTDRAYAAVGKRRDWSE